MKYIYFITFLILALATLGSVQAQFDTNISDGCKNELLKIFGDKDINACFPVQSFLSLVSTASGGAVPSDADLKKAADSTCGLPKCSDDLVKKTQSDFQTACQSDLTNDKSAVQYLNVAINLYPPTRDSICYKNSTDGYCFIETKATTQQLISSAPAGQSPAFTFAAAKPEDVCTPCNKAIFNTYFNYQKTNPDAFKNIKGLDMDNIGNVLGGKCGKNFLDGNVGDSTESPADFTKQNGKKSDASSLIANRLSFIALAGSILATL